MDNYFDQAQRFGQMWLDFMMRSMQAATGMTPQTPPLEAMRQVRTAMLGAMSQAAEQWMRSPQFLDLMKQSMDGALSYWQQLSGVLTQARHATQGVAHEDVDALMVSVRHLEQRLLDRMEEMSDRVEELSRDMEQLGRRLAKLNGNGRTSNGQAHDQPIRRPAPAARQRKRARSPEAFNPAE